MSRIGMNRDGSKKPLIKRQTSMAESITKILFDLPDAKARAFVMELVTASLAEKAADEARQLSVQSAIDAQKVNAPSQAAVQQPAGPSNPGTLSHAGAAAPSAANPFGD